ncbi:hypothetical protein Ocin01_18976 [Orchesella cincta]|uniref:Uncharacterized protein n=1 Tax=Orchesella cincta TaxID=48709 RepID=A0A1D2M3Z7_ORCCI|nr:hypothetical protein Ocin01_18976 [Orchesella cincta]
MVPLQFPLNPNATGVAEWNPIVLTSGAKLITPPVLDFELVVYDYFYSQNCSSWINVHSFDGTTAMFHQRICGYTGQKSVSFLTKGLFIVCFLRVPFRQKIFWDP